MAAKKSTEAKPEGEKKVRVQLTPEQRIAKLEADLAAAREKAQAKNQKRIDVLLEQRAKLEAKHLDLNAKVDAIEAELTSLGYMAETQAEAPAEVQPESTED